MKFADLPLGQLVACRQMQLTGQFPLFTELQDLKTKRLAYVPAADPYFSEIPIGAYLKGAR